MKIVQSIYEQIINHANKDLPNEACGYLAGKNEKVSMAFPITNTDQSHEHFSFDPEEQFAAIKEMRKLDLSPIAVYHSHPHTPARPSKEDIRLAYDPGISHVIISLAENTPVIKSFKIEKDTDNHDSTLDAQVESEEIEVI